jgi:hypothetical protein
MGGREREGEMERESGGRVVWGGGVGGWGGGGVGGGEEQTM